MISISMNGKFPLEIYVISWNEEDYLSEKMNVFQSINDLNMARWNIFLKKSIKDHFFFCLSPRDK